MHLIIFSTTMDFYKSIGLIATITSILNTYLAIDICYNSVEYMRGILLIFISLSLYIVAIVRENFDSVAIIAFHITYNAMLIMFLLSYITYHTYPEIKLLPSIVSAFFIGLYSILIRINIHPVGVVLLFIFLCICSFYLPWDKDLNFFFICLLTYFSTMFMTVKLFVRDSAAGTPHI